MKRQYLIIVCFLAVIHAFAVEPFITFRRDKNTALELTHQADTVIYDANEWAGVKIAVGNLRKDLISVTGHKCAPIIVATVGKSKLARQYPQFVKQLKNKWEKYIITNIKVHNKPYLLILGSDKRGTIYGIYELSRQIGVSPWYWMADVPIKPHNDLFVAKGIYTDGEPAVKYRGIFINDEWPSFGTWCKNEFGGINSKAYSRIFELLLRLKANFFWPAMWNSSFNEDDSLSPKMADQMGIVMGTSHHEPMMRSHMEYVNRRKEVGPWDYTVNSERLNKFFTEGLERNKSYDNIITIGMRGDGDVAMGKGNDEDNMKTLADVIHSQRNIIRKVYGRSPEEVPQLWAIFTEVQRYYDAGFNVPDDVTLLFCDNNWGYIRRKGTIKDSKRKGGLGLYYHIDMNGGPWNDRWINTTTVPKLREQLNLAYQSGINRIWIINVGDLKPKEIPIDFIMKYAWNPKAYPAGCEKKYLEDFSSSIFGKVYSNEIADIIAKYSKYNLWRKPEVQYPGIFNKSEMQIVQNKWQILENRTEKLKSLVPAKAQNAFYELVYYPVIASAGVAKIYNYATLGDSMKIEKLMLKDSLLSDYYNHQLAGGKWNGMMLDNHIGYTEWSIPKSNRNPMTLGFKVNYNINSTTKTTEYSIPANQYDAKGDKKNVKWIYLPDLGRSEGCMGINNVMAKSYSDASGPYLEYTIQVTSTKQQSKVPNVAIGILPTQDICPKRGLRIGVKIDHSPLHIIDAREGLVDIFNEYTPQNLSISKVLKALPSPSRLSLSGFVEGKQQPRRNEVFDNIRWLDGAFNVKPGKHTLRIYMIDPEIVIEQIVVNPDNNHYSYFGNGVNL